MAITTTLASCSTNPALNGPDGSVDLPSSLDDAIRYALSFIAQLRDGAGMPVGAIIPFSGPNPGLGYVVGNGTLLSRTTYANLFAYAGAAGLVTEAVWTAGSFGRYSVGDGSTTFRVPDFRAMFLRALDQSRGIDVSRAIGVDQGADNAPHVHGVTDPTHFHGVNDPGHIHGTDQQGQHNHPYTRAHLSGSGVNALPGALGNITDGEGVIGTENSGLHGHNITRSTTGISIYSAATGLSIQSSGAEGRPRNLAYPFCIKF